MVDPIRAALERLVELEDSYNVNGADPDTTQWDNAIDAARTALAAEPVDGLSPKEIEAQEAFTQMRDDVLGGVDGLDNDQINSILHIIDNYTPEWV